MKKLLYILGFAVAFTIFYHVVEYFLYLINIRDSFEIEPIIFPTGLFGAIIIILFESAPNDRGKSREWDREDWVDPLADDDEQTK